MIHLVNDAVQSKGEGYSEKGSNKEACKMSQSEFESWMSRSLHVDCTQKIYPQMKNIMYDSIRATHHKMNENKIKGCFEIFGYDLMIDSDLKMWLIEVNTNSCLSLNSSWQAQIIPKMLQQTFEKTVGRFYPKPETRRVLVHSNSNPNTPSHFKLHANLNARPQSNVFCTHAHLRVKTQIYNLII